MTETTPSPPQRRALVPPRKLTTTLSAVGATLATLVVAVLASTSCTSVDPESGEQEWWIEQLPGGYQFNVGERGVNLSTGQRQLIAFARTLAHDPRILVLDEATSSIDTATEVLIQDAIEKLLAGRTALVIAHRLSTIRNADRILVMHHGELREQGTHDELLAMDGLYRKLYELQYLDESAA